MNCQIQFGMVFSHGSWPSPRSFGGPSTAWRFEGGSETSRKKYSAYSNGSLACSVAALALSLLTCDANIAHDIYRSICCSPVASKSGSQVFKQLKKRCPPKDWDKELRRQSGRIYIFRRWAFLPTFQQFMEPFIHRRIGGTTVCSVWICLQQWFQVSTGWFSWRSSKVLRRKNYIV